MKRIIILTAAAGLFFLSQSCPAQKITIRGNRFYAGERQIFLNGVNTPWDKWNDFGGAYDHGWWDAEFQRLKDARVNCVRVWIHCDGGKSPTTSEDGVVSGASDAFWTHMDNLFALVLKHELYLMPALWSFDMPKTNDRYKKLLSDRAKVQAYVDRFLVPLVRRFNGHPRLLGWEICNEPEWMFENYGVPQSQVLRMHAMLAAAIHESCSDYVTTGAAAVKWNGRCKACVGNLWSDESLKNHHPDKNPKAFFDFYQVHYYPWQDPWFDTPFKNTVSAYGVPDNRPVVIGEMWARASPIATSNYSGTDSTAVLVGHPTAWTTSARLRYSGKRFSIFTKNIQKGLILPSISRTAILCKGGAPMTVSSENEYPTRVRFIEYKGKSILIQDYSKVDILHHAAEP